MSDVKDKPVDDPDQDCEDHDSDECQFDDGDEVLVAGVFIADHVEEEDDLTDDEADHKGDVEVVGEAAFGGSVADSVYDVDAVEYHEEDELDGDFPRDEDEGHYKLEESSERDFHGKLRILVDQELVLFGHFIESFSVLACQVGDGY